MCMGEFSASDVLKPGAIAWSLLCTGLEVFHDDFNTFFWVQNTVPSVHLPASVVHPRRRPNRLHFGDLFFRVPVMGVSL